MVRNDATGFVSVHATEVQGSDSFAVTYVSPGKPVIYLADGMPIPEEAARRVAASSGGLLSEQEVAEVFGRLRQQIRLEHLFKAKELRRSPVWPVIAVAERLDLCRRLEDLEPSALFHHDRGLVHYLLLTCFDTLGQNPDWIDYSGWLEASDRHDERERACESIMSDSAPVEIAAQLHREYLRLYGASLAFKHFLNDVLPDSARRFLFDSIRIEKFPYASSASGEVRVSLGSDAEKAKLLYQVRNEFTHRGERFGGPRGIPTAAPAGLDKMWLHVRQEHHASYIRSIYTSEWPYVLERTVQVGLAEYLRRL